MNEPKSLTAFYSQILDHPLVIKAIEEYRPEDAKEVLTALKNEMAYPFHIFHAHRVVWDAVIAGSHVHQTIVVKAGRKPWLDQIMKFNDEIFWVKQNSETHIGFFSSVPNVMEYLAEIYS